jgi:hypothetical protein
MNENENHNGIISRVEPKPARSMNVPRVVSNEEKPTNMISSNVPGTNTPNKPKNELEEQKKKSNFRLFVLFVILDIALFAFVITEIVLLFLDIAKNGI